MLWPRGMQTLPCHRAAKHGVVTGSQRQSCAKKAASRAKGCCFHGNCHSSWACQELSRAGFLPPSCDIIFSFEMPSSRYTRADRHTHISATFSSTFAQGRRGGAPSGTFQAWQHHFSSSSISNLGKVHGGGASDGGERGTSCCPGTQESEEELGGHFVVCVQGCSHLVNQFPAVAVTNYYSSFTATWTTRPSPGAERRCKEQLT